MNLIIGQRPETEFCPTCGLPLLLNGGCKKYHGVKNKKRGRFSGRSKSEHAFGEY